jgi:hypothetical protein
MTPGSLRKRIIIPVGTVLVALLVSAAWGYWLTGRDYLFDTVRSRVKTVRVLFRENLARDFETMRGLISLLDRDPGLREAWLARDREALLKHAEPIFKELRRRHRVTHFYFHGLDRVCFLRVHSAERYGDAIERFTLNGAMERERTVGGIELGPLGTLTLRVVGPWYLDGKLAGYIELGEEIEHITPQLRRTVGAELLFLIDKRHLDRAGWEEGLRMLGRSDDWEQLSDFVVVDATLDETALGLEALIPDPGILADEDFLTPLKSPGRSYYAGVLNLHDAGTRHVGYIVVLDDVTKEVASVQRMTLLLGLIVIVLGGGLLAFFWLYLGGVELEQIRARTRLAELLAEHGQIGKQLGKDEKDLWA